MLAWAAHILERVAREALIRRQCGTAHLNEAEERQSEQREQPVQSLAHGVPETCQVGSRSPDGVRGAVQIVMGPWPWGWVRQEPLEGSGVDLGLGRIPLAALKGKEGKAEAGRAEAGPEALVVIQA